MLMKTLLEAERSLNEGQIPVNVQWSGSFFVISSLMLCIRERYGDGRGNERKEKICLAIKRRLKKHFHIRFQY